MSDSDVLGGEKRRVVTFNLGNLADRELYQFFLRDNFSGLVKQLLTVEMKRRKSGTIQFVDKG